MARRLDKETPAAELKEALMASPRVQRVAIESECTPHSGSHRKSAGRRARGIRLDPDSESDSTRSRGHTWHFSEHFATSVKKGRSTVDRAIERPRTLDRITRKRLTRS